MNFVHDVGVVGERFQRTRHHGGVRHRLVVAPFVVAESDVDGEGGKAKKHGHGECHDDDSGAFVRAEAQGHVNVPAAQPESCSIRMVTVVSKEAGSGIPKLVSDW